MSGTTNTTPDPIHVFLLAERFREASEILNEKHARQTDYQSSAPMLTLDAFSVELYLKCIFILDRHAPPPRLHRFDQLFRKLTPGIQGVVRHQYQLNIANNPVLRNLQLINPDAVRTLDFDLFLRVASDTFEKTRYIFEAINERPSEWFYASLFRDALRTLTHDALKHRLSNS